MKRIIFGVLVFVSIWFSFAQSNDTWVSYDVNLKNKQKVLEEIKERKIERISQVESKLLNIIPKAESINYNTKDLETYVNKLSNIKNNLDKNNRVADIKRYNIELKWTMNSIRQEMSDLKQYYKNR